MSYWQRIWVAFQPWHAGLICKPCQNVICSDLINIPNDSLINKKQRVASNGECSSWIDIRAGVPQGFTLGPLFCCLEYLSNVLKSRCKLFADDISSFSVVRDVNTSLSEIKKDLQVFAFFVQVHTPRKFLKILEICY